MQKNESTLLWPWVAYHAALFGFENLYVFDNGSTQANVLAELDRIETLGVVVDRRHGAAADFANKGHILGERMRALRDAGGYDFLIPLDCDEFFALRKEGEVVFDRADILAGLAPLVTEVKLPQVVSNYLNVLGTTDLFLEAAYQKVFFQARGFFELEHGFHLGRSTLSEEHLTTDFVYIHCHAKPFDVIVEHSRTKLSYWCDVNDPDALMKLETDKGIGWHLVKYLQITESEYLSIFRTDQGVRIPGFAAALEAAGADPSFLLGKQTSAQRGAAQRGTDLDFGGLAPGTRLVGKDVVRPSGNGVIVVGPLGPETAGILGALDRLGITVCPVADFYLDRRWAEGLQTADKAGVKRWLLVRAAQAERWGAWLSDLLALDAEAIEALRHPYVIEVRRGGYIASDTDGPSRLLVDPGHDGADWFRIAETILSFCGLPIERGTVAAIVTATMGLRQDPAIEGWIDVATDDAVDGWCWSRGSTSRLTIELYADGTKVASGVANAARSDLLAAGKGDGRFGFSIPIGRLGIVDGVRLDGVVAGSGHRLGNSGATLQQLRRK